MLISCRECGKDVSSEAKICPHCGYSGGQNESSEKATETKKSHLAGWIIAGVVLIWIGSCMVRNSTEYSAALEKCMKNGVKYYQEIGSYPNLSNGEDAHKTVARKCRNSLIAFGE